MGVGLVVLELGVGFGPGPFSQVLKLLETSLKRPTSRQIESVSSAVAWIPGAFATHERRWHVLLGGPRLHKDPGSGTRRPGHQKLNESLGFRGTQSCLTLCVHYAIGLAFFQVAGDHRLEVGLLAPNRPHTMARLLLVARVGATTSLPLTSINLSEVL